MIKESISKVVSGKDLTETEMEMAMTEMMTGSASSAQIGAYSSQIKGRDRG